MTGRADWLALFATASGTVGRRERVWAAAVVVLGLVYLAYLQYARGGMVVSGWVGAALFAAGCGWAVWLGLAQGVREQRQGIVLLVLLTALAVVRAIMDEAFSELVYLSIISALVLPVRVTLPVIAAITLTQCGFLIVYGKVLAIGAVGFSLQTAFLGLAMLGLRRMVDLARELTGARQELARLAVNEGQTFTRGTERSRVGVV